MTAKEAKQQALSVSEGANKQAFKTAINVIEKAVKRGEMDCQVYDALPVGTVNELKALGYAVKSDMDRNESYTTISWKDAI